MRTAIRIGLGLLFCFSAPTFVECQTPRLPAARPAGNEAYVLGPGDVVAISFEGELMSGRECAVGADGSISLAVVPRKISAAGKTIGQLQQVIEDAYRTEHLLNSPRVTISLKAVRSSPVTVAGAVPHSVTIQVQDRSTLLQAIAMAGGSTAAGCAKIVVSRPSTTDAAGATVPGSSQTIGWQVLMSRPNDASVNLILQRGDVVTVERGACIYVGGTVRKPGMLTTENGEVWTVRKALAAVGPVIWNTRTKAVILRAQPDGAEETIPLNLDLIMKDHAPDVGLVGGDVLLVQRLDFQEQRNQDVPLLPFPAPLRPLGPS
jgi:polysaccharide export outer membrane protein